MRVCEPIPLQLLILALDAALYPTLLAAVVILLNQPRRLTLLSTYLAGGLAISVSLGLGIVFALKSSSALHNSRSGLSWTTDLAIGGLVLLLAVALATRADARFAERRKARKPADPNAEKRERSRSASSREARCRSS
jgi:Sap-like sulfolipid-1-addressing protein